MRPAELQVVQQAELPSGLVFWYWGRPLRVVRCEGADKAAPVIVEEMESHWAGALAGQLSIWSLDGVRLALDRNMKKPRGVLRSVR